MSSNFTAEIKYERRGDKVIPVMVRREPDTNGKTRTVRITELSFPITGACTDELFAEAEADGWEATYLANTRQALILASVLCPAPDYPMDDAYLPLDDKAREVHAYDVEHDTNHRYATDNHWVPSLFGDEDMESDDEPT